MRCGMEGCCWLFLGKMLQDIELERTKRMEVLGRDRLWSKVEETRLLWSSKFGFGFEKTRNWTFNFKDLIKVDRMVVVSKETMMGREGKEELLMDFERRNSRKTNKLEGFANAINKMALQRLFQVSVFGILLVWGNSWVVLCKITRCLTLVR